MAEAEAPVVEKVDAPRATVLTSENAQEFYARKLNLPQAEEVKTEVKQEPEVKTEEVKTEEKQETEGQRKGREYAEKLSKARDEAKQEREKREAAEKKAAELEAKLNPPPKEEEGKPKPEQFTDAFEYAEALTDWKVEQREKARDQEIAKKSIEQQRNSVVKTFVEKQNAFKETTPDYQEVLAAADEAGVKVSDAVRDAIIESDFGPQVMYHLAKNPDEAERIAKLSVLGALKAIGKLETKFEKADTKAEVKAEVSKAPEPINPIKGGTSTQTVKVDASGEFKGTYAEWKEARKAGKIK